MFYIITWNTCSKYFASTGLHFGIPNAGIIVRVIFTDCGDAITYSLKAGKELRERINGTRFSTVACTGYYRVEYRSFLQTKPQAVLGRFQTISKGVDKTE